MKNRWGVVRLGSAGLRVTLFAAMLTLAAGTSHADREGGRGSWMGGRSRENGGQRDKSDRGERRFKDQGARTRGGGGDAGRAWARPRSEGSWNGGNARRMDGGDFRGQGDGGRAARTRGDGGGTRPDGGGAHAWGGGTRPGGGGSHSYGGGTSTWGGSGAYGGGHSRTYVRRGPVAYGGGSGCYGGGSGYYGGGASYYGGAPYCAPRSYAPVVYRYARPRSYTTFRIGIGYYCPPSYRVYDRPAPVVVEPELQVDVENEPPAGCYYYDSFCQREFATLDEYTEHVDNENHAKTIEIIERDSGEPVRTLEFVDGYWGVQR